jgi:hypothetical protein
MIFNVETDYSSKVRVPKGDDELNTIFITLVEVPHLWSKYTALNVNKIKTIFPPLTPIPTQPIVRRIQDRLSLLFSSRRVG